MTKKIHISILFLISSLLSSGQVIVLDNFTDGNYIASPIWTLITGTASVSSASLVVRAEGFRMSTPFTTDCMEWGYSIKSSASGNCGDFRYFFLLKDDPSPTVGSGYCIEYDGSGDTYTFWKSVAGSLTSLGSYAAGSPNTNSHNIVITRDASYNYFVSIDGTVRITANDNTYLPSACQYQAIRAVTCVACTCTDTYGIDNIYYVPACLNPSSGGVISGNQSSICGSYDPTTISSTSAAIGHTGILEYKWQSSITNSVSGFSDIAVSNATTYDPSSITQTTWYKRLARVTCKGDWTGAAESNVIEKRVDPSISIIGFSLNDTVYNQLGNASFGVFATPIAGLSYQWQVSTNGGSSWSNISNGGFYLGVTTATLQVTNPIYGMDGYLFCCSLTNACGILNSPSAKLRVIQASTFSNTTSTSCGTNLNNDYSFQRNITVTGLPTPLGTSSGQYVLRQVNLQLGTTSCEGILSTYQARLKSPNGTIIQLFNQFTDNNSAAIWANIKYRDHAALERIREYTNANEGTYYPFSIGYYAIETDGSFFSVNGQNPNGTWTLELAENTDLANDGGADDEVSFQKVELVFGPKFSYTDITSSTANDNCSAPRCLSTQEIIIGTNNGYTSSEPLASFVGTTADGCGWNGANNNSAWYSFVASATSAYITISGMVNPSAGGNDTQPIIFSRTGDCSSMGTISVPTGGCLDDVSDISSVNLMDYLTPNGGVSNINNLYTNGLSMNAEFKLSGLTVGQTYYLYVDGNGGTSSTFYIEALNGCQTCNTILPIELVNFDYSCNNEILKLEWITASEKDNEYFTILGSTDANEWLEIGMKIGAGYSSEIKHYEFDVPSQYSYLKYFKLAQHDYDSHFKFSNIISVDCEAENLIDFYPNPFNNELNFTVKSNEPVSYEITTVLGQIVNSGVISKDNSRVSLEDLASDIYFIKINNSKVHKIIKQ
jgi:hypothetical protein